LGRDKRKCNVEFQNTTITTFGRKVTQGDKEREKFGT
jgi:hypothetical protein